MKILILISLLTLTACGNHPLEANGKVYNCYGFMDQEDRKPEVVYEVSGENILGAIFFSETLFIPVWNLGWNIYCPVRVLPEQPVVAK